MMMFEWIVAPFVSYTLQVYGITQNKSCKMFTHSPFYTFRASIGLVRPIFVALFKACTVDHKIEGSRNIHHGAIHINLRRFQNAIIPIAPSV